jgi:maltose alpha-D-glucosyltransferase/alpha-amylase
LVNLWVEEQSAADPSGIHRIALEAYGYRWYRVGTLNHILRRQPE